MVGAWKKAAGLAVVTVTVAVAVATSLAPPEPEPFTPEPLPVYVTWQDAWTDEEEQAVLRRTHRLCLRAADAQAVACADQQTKEACGKWMQTVNHCRYWDPDLRKGWDE